MSRRERIEAILAEIDKTTQPAIEIGLSVRLVRKHLWPELRLLWAIQESAERRCFRRHNHKIRCTCGNCDALDAYEADND
jgi:hypothetical protein